MAQNKTKAETARVVRKLLKSRFPQTEFSVRSRRKSDAIDIYWQDGVANNKVKQALLFLKTENIEPIPARTKFKSTKWTNEEINFSGYLFYYRKYSKGFVEKVLKYCEEKYAEVSGQIIIQGDEESGYNFNISPERDRRLNYHILKYCQEELEESNSDREFNWKLEAQEIDDFDKLEERLVAEQKAKDEQYLDSIPKPKQYTDKIGKIVKNYEVIGVRTKFCGDTCYFLRDGKLGTGGINHFQEIPPYEERKTYFRLEVKNLETSQLSIWDLHDYANVSDPIVPLKIMQANVFCSGQFASLNKQNTLDRYRKECNKPQLEKTYSNYGDLGKHREYIENWRYTKCLVIEEIFLSQPHYDRFINDLLSDRNWLKGKGGTGSDATGLREVNNIWEYTKEELEIWKEKAYNICVAIVAENRETILVNPEGYPYARYVAFLVNKE